jgi:CDP-diacylglycerol--glycerol-3-phosphate 3-phosphatidyltransferase
VPFVRWWLGLAYAVGRPLAAARVAPTALTVLGLALAAAVVPVAGLGGRWPALGTMLVVVSGLVDNLDGTVAVLSDRVTRWGALADAVCDRVADAAYAVAFWVLGAPAWLCLLWAGLSYLAEYARARGQVLLAGPVEVVTVGERPTRVVVTAIFLAGAALLTAQADVVVTVGAAAGAGAAAVGLLQLGRALRRRLADPRG